MRNKIHRLMLEDKPRNIAYKNAIISNKDLFKNKIILDIGTGTGILSILCAQAGAKKVYAVEASNIASLAEEIVKENGFTDVIQVSHCRIEDFELDDKVDIIVSEWMGFYLLHEGMLDSVICARDRFLKEDGLLFPEECILYTAPCQLPSFYQFWDDIYGIKMNSFGKKYRKIFEGKPEIREVLSENLLNEGNEFVKFNLNFVKNEDLDRISQRQVVACIKDGIYQGICMWFCVKFPSINGKDCVTLSTKPDNPLTHWKQTVIVLPVELPVESGDAVAWELTLQRLIDKPRSYSILLTMLDPDEESHPIPCDCHRPKCLIIKTYLSQLPPEDDDNDENDIAT
ncbi:arginine methyltransferase 8 isoform X2 [Lycorma delicatula]|uniref:arginine methyltransferase 8 isoform X2 n=1 Tax=Lycorma delicatula TaxID=130591 RepID=UPI003F50DE66